MDERLRELERDARARPGDVQARRAYLRALEKAGDSTSAWLAWCRLARGADDQEAWAALDRAPTSLRSTPEVVATRTLPNAVRLASADRRGVALLGHGVLDPGDLTTRWVITESKAAASGPRICQAGPAVAIVHDLASGSELGRRALHRGARPTIERLHATADRAVLLWRDFTPRGAMRLLTLERVHAAGCRRRVPPP